MLCTKFESDSSHSTFLTVFVVTEYHPRDVGYATLH